MSQMGGGQDILSRTRNGVRGSSSVDEQMDGNCFILGRYVPYAGDAKFGKGRSIWQVELV